MADPDNTHSEPGTSDPGSERRESDRRDPQLDRRAFWRPTPDRRREATEQGRREQDSNRDREGAVCRRRALTRCGCTSKTA